MISVFFILFLPNIINANDCNGCSGTCDLTNGCTSSCNSGYVIQNNSGFLQCVQCTSPCDNCSGSPNSCSSCIIGYVISGTSCVACASPCAECQAQPFTCTVCIDSGNMTLTSNVCSCTISNYYFNGTVCTACPVQCTTCTSVSSCNSCSNGYYLSGFTCIACTSPCATCVNFAHECTSCTTPHTVANSGICVCDDGYFGNGSSCLSCDTSKCATCVSSPTYCLTCVNDMIESGGNCICNPHQYNLGGNCINCPDPCSSCMYTTQLLCTSCQNGSYISNNDCLYCRPECATCTDYDTCFSCVDISLTFSIVTTSCTCTDPTKVFSGTTCTTCQSPCDTCSGSPTSCDSCESGYYLSTHTCIACTPPCGSCHINGLICDSCVDSSNMTYSGNSCTCTDPAKVFNGSVCASCTNPCATCSVTPTHCVTCVDPYQSVNPSYQCECVAGRYYDGSACQLCTAPCNTCENTDDYCTSCLDSVNMYLNPSHQCICSNPSKHFVGTACSICILPCVTCITNLVTCTSCIDPLQSLINYKCLCPDTYYEDSITNMCVPCQNPCLNCSSLSQCLSCQDKYYLHGADCLQCLEPCNKCEFLNNHCLDCMDLFMNVDSNFQCVCQNGYFQFGFECLPCEYPCNNCQIHSHHCLDCVSSQFQLESNRCICQDGYFLSVNVCLPCNLPCTKCQQTADNCLSCLDSNQILINNQCICKDGYNIDPIDISLCSYLPYPCMYSSQNINCLRCVSSYKIVNQQCVCDDGYFDQLGQCLKCDLKCKTCINTYDNCLECSSIQASIQNNCLCPINYLTIPGQCVKCKEPCQTCSSDISLCTSCIYKTQIANNYQCKCIDGYYQVNQSCLECDGTCTKCISKTQCLECIQTYYLDDSQCFICQSPCLTCISINSCLSCAQNYFLNGNTCFNCIKHCITCSNQYSCDECQSGYYLSNNNCYKCSDNCKTCQNNSITCLTCYDLKQTINLKNQCECSKGYYQSDNLCYQCSQLCDKCINQEYCIVCQQLDNVSLINNQCKCSNGYYFFSGSCSLCDPFCLSCDQTSSNCTSCPLNRSLIKMNNQHICQCKTNYYTDEMNQCQSCYSEVGKLKKECHYANCEDNMWTWGEQCDDGNSISRDGCTNCKIDSGYQCWGEIGYAQICKKLPQNCLISELSLDQTLICIECKIGYFLAQNFCRQCSDICSTCVDSPSNCLTCKYIKINGKCSQCSDQPGYYLYNNKCTTKCGDGLIADNEQCDDGNTMNGDGCNNECRIEQKYKCIGESSLCYKQQFLQMKLIAYPGDIYNNVRQLSLKFDQLIYNQSLLSDIKMEVVKQKEIQTQYINQNYENSILIDQYYNYTININLTFTQTCIDCYLRISFTNYNSIISLNNQSLEYNNISTQFDDFIFVDQATIAATESASQGSLSLLILLAILAGIALIFGGLDIFYNLLDTLQLISYLKYINTQFPYNLDQFLELFRFAQFQFLEDYLKFSDFLSDVPEEYMNSSPPKIQSDGITPLVLINFGSIISVWSCFFGLYIIALIIPILLKQMQIKLTTFFDSQKTQGILILKVKLLFLFIKLVVFQFCMEIQNTFIYSGLLRTHISTAYDYSFAVTVNISSYYLSSANQIIKLSSILTLIGLFIYMYLVYLTTICCGHASKRNSKLINDKYGASYEGLKLSNLGQYYVVICMIKRFCFISAIVLCYEQPVFQIMNLILSSIINLLLLMLLQPLSEIEEFIKQITCEIFILITVMSLLVLVGSNEYKLYLINSSMIGWICITSISLIIVIQLIIDARQQWLYLYKQYKIIRRLFNRFSSNNQNQEVQNSNGSYGFV